MFVDVLFALLIQWCIYVLYIQISHHFLTYLNLVLAHFDYFEVTHTTYRHISVLGTYCGVIYRCNTFLHNSFRHLMKHIHRLVNYYTNWLIKTQPNIFLTFDVSVSTRDLPQKKFYCILVCCAVDSLLFCAAKLPTFRTLFAPVSPRFQAKSLCTTGRHKRPQRFRRFAN